MILNRIVLSGLVGLLLAPAPAVAQDHGPLIRRIATTAVLAAQEYALGVEDGKVVLEAEVEEARLFLTEAAAMAARLPSPSDEEARRAFEAALAIVNRTGSPDAVMTVVDAALEALAARHGVALVEIPESVAVAAHGASLYRVHCASCHGDRGRGDGPAAAGLDPPPPDLADAGALADATPLDFFRRTTVGVSGTAMPGFEALLSEDDRWAVAVYASTLRLPAASGDAPARFAPLAATAQRSDRELLEALGPGASLATVAAIRLAAMTAAPVTAGQRRGVTFARVRALVDSSVRAALAGDRDEARQAALGAYLAYEAVERDVRARDAGVADRAEAAFAMLRDRGPTASPGALRDIERALAASLEHSERVLTDSVSRLGLFLQSLVILLREGLEAILIIGALLAFVTKTGAPDRRRDIHVGVGAAVIVSLFTALLIETVFHLSPAHQEVLEGFTMVAAAVMLFYVSYWLLTKVEVHKWNAFVRSQVREAVGSGSVLALATVAFLAVYREGFETVLFYKALFLAGGPGGWPPIVAGMAVGTVLLAIVYVAINRYGVRLPLKPFFAVTSAFLYYMAFVFAGKAVAELQGGGLVGTTPVLWAPRVPMLGIYPTVESLLAQAVLVALALVALAWIFMVEPARARRAVEEVLAEGVGRSSGAETAEQVEHGR